MGSFLKSFRKDVGSAAPPVGAPPPKKELQPLPMTPLEKMLMELGPIREDGSDKFFGMENFGNTCYCNSILQCLYYSVPFREAVLNYPKRTPIESLEAALAKALRYQDPNARQEAEALAEKQKAANPPRPGQPPNPQQKPEDKDSPEYKKKIALQTLPLLETANNSDSYAMAESLFTSMKDIFESVVGSQSRIGIIRPQHFLDVLRREHEMFRTAMHQDAHEFLNLLLNAVVTNVEDAAKEPPPEKLLPAAESSESLQPSSSSGLKTPNTTRWVHELFEGLLTSETQCLACEKVSQRDEVFLDLSVDLEQHSSVTSCLRKFSAEETLCEKNKFHCDNCGGLQEAEKRMKIKRLPRILALHLKRFKYTEDLQRLQKLFHRVVYPYHLRLFNTTDDAEDPDRLYELYAVVVHIGGGPYHGHYVAIIKTQDRGWLLFDDEMVEPVDKNYVRNFFGDKPGLACAYVLFYQETTMEAMMKEQEQENMEPPAEANPFSTKQNGFAHSPALAHVHSASQIPIPEEHDRFTGLKRAPTAPQLSTHYEHADAEPPVSPASPAPAQTPIASLPPIPPIPETPSSPLVSRKSDLQYKKERAKEEKERKAREEKERKEKEKQRRKVIEAEFRENQRRDEANLKAALEASKATKEDEDRRNHKENGSAKKPAGSLGRFRSFSQRISKDKESRQSLPPMPPLPNGDHSSSKVSVEQGQSEILRKPVSRPPSEPLSPPPTNHVAHPSPPEVSTPPAQPEQQDSIRNSRHDRSSGHGKWRSFSLRKKSFNILSS